MTNYSLFKLKDVLLDVYSPVLDPTEEVIGIVRLNYQVASVYDLFVRFRFLIGGVILFGLLFSIAVASFLAFNIGKPIQQVTQAIYDLATGRRYEPLAERGPDDLRRQIRAVNFFVDQLHNLELARRHLLANLVHELGRPLGALRSAIQALSKGAAKDPELVTELALGMDQEAGRLQHVLDDLAHLYDQVIGSLELNMQTLEIKEWLPDMLRPWETAAKEKQLDWIFQISESMPTVQADPLRLAQIVGNLTSNAIKYTSAGGAIHINVGEVENEIYIGIGDTGPGIPEDEKEKIFLPFYRGNYGKRIKQGMGLGLSIASDLVKAHGGRIELETQPGSGSLFTIWLPRS